MTYKDDLEDKVQSYPDYLRTGTAMDQYFGLQFDFLQAIEGLVCYFRKSSLRERLLIMEDMKYTSARVIHGVGKRSLMMDEDVLTQRTYIAAFLKEKMEEKNLSVEDVERISRERHVANPGMYQPIFTVDYLNKIQQALVPWEDMSIQRRQQLYDLIGTSVDEFKAYYHKIRTEMDLHDKGCRSSLTGKPILD